MIMLARCCGSMQKTTRKMMRPVAASSCASCICLQHCACGKVEPLATFCMCASCESSRQHHCQHAIISSSHHPGCDPRSACSCHQGSAPHAAEQMAEDFIRAARALFLARNKRNMRVARTDERTGLSHVCLHTAVCIGLLASCDMRAGVVWLESANRRGKAWREDLSSADILLRLQLFSWRRTWSFWTSCGTRRGLH